MKTFDMKSFDKLQTEKLEEIRHALRAAEEECPGMTVVQLDAFISLLLANQRATEQQGPAAREGHEDTSKTSH